MSNEVLVKVEGVSKKFCKSLKRSMLYGVQDITRDIFNAVPSKQLLRKDEFWAVDDVSFEIRRGECLGLIGPNGAGKSTLLKMISGIILPDKGTIEVHGRVGALIELGAGFHPMLTGRENIYINGCILGLTKKEVDANFNSIVDFAGLNDFIDTPVKFYSSGMYVRLGFAVAAHLKPDVLLIDEVLAVGDVGFRSKCYNVISEISRRRAVVFVTHSIQMLARMAQNTIVLNNGKIHYKGSVNQAILKYYEQFETNEEEIRAGSGEVIVDKVNFGTGEENDNDKVSVTYGKPLHIDIRITALKNIDNLVVNIVFRNMPDDIVAECNNFVNPYQISICKSTTKDIKITINEITLNPGSYKVGLLLMSHDMMQHYDWIRTLRRIEVRGPKVGTAAQQFKVAWEVT